MHICSRRNKSPSPCIFSVKTISLPHIFASPGGGIQDPSLARRPRLQVSPANPAIRPGRESSYFPGLPFPSFSSAPAETTRTHTHGAGLLPPPPCFKFTRRVAARASGVIVIALCSLEVIVVDCSTDPTDSSRYAVLGLASQFGTRVFRLMGLAAGRTLGEALQQGALAARGSLICVVRAPVTAWVPARVALAELERLEEALQGQPLALAYGARVAASPPPPSFSLRMRELLAASAGCLAGWLLPGVCAADPQSGLFMLTRSAAQLLLPALHPRALHDAPELELLFLARLAAVPVALVALKADRAREQELPGRSLSSLAGGNFAGALAMGSSLRRRAQDRLAKAGSTIWLRSRELSLLRGLCATRLAYAVGFWQPPVQVREAGMAGPALAPAAWSARGASTGPGAAAMRTHGFNLTPRGKPHAPPTPVRRAP
jgi:hypothetical protein